jgi:CASP C terminal
MFNVTRGELICKQDTLIRSSPIPFAPSADTSILPIVTSQRDRFRQRNAELEEVFVSQVSPTTVGIKHSIS